MLLLTSGNSEYYTRYTPSGFYGIDWTYVFVIIGFVICLIAKFNCERTFDKYKKVRSSSGLTGAEAARRILNNAGIYDVSITRVSGKMTDYYSPKDKRLALSDSTYDNTSVAAIGVAAHECGHAIQHDKGYVPVVLRSMIAPAVTICSKLSIPLIMLGFILSLYSTLVPLGIILFSVTVIFSIVTLPVEFNASHRALKILDSNGILGHDEVKKARKVLSAAAMTYVAGTISSALQLLRLILLSQRRRR
ncbi:MAG: zinc metallopeptidase [Lachnospiraceae bacterium]|nr:zinc metallopeptidase [Lachnospiraceae bacterium]